MSERPDPLRRRPVLGAMLLAIYLPIALFSVLVILVRSFGPQIQEWAAGESRPKQGQTVQRPRKSDLVLDSDVFGEFEPPVSKLPPELRIGPRELQWKLYHGDRDERIQWIEVIPKLGKDSPLFLRDLKLLRGDESRSINEAARIAIAEIEADQRSRRDRPQP